MLQTFLEKCGMLKHRSKELTAAGEFSLQKRHGVFLALNIVLLLMWYAPLSELMSLALKDKLYSHVPLVVLVSGYLIYVKRKNIHGGAHYSLASGGGFIALSLALFFIGRAAKGIADPNDALSLAILSAVLFWSGSFIACYGTGVARQTWFAMFFLVFIIPIPTIVLDNVVAVLQWGSAHAAHGILMLTGVPFVREGFSFHLPNLSVFVAEECSGIRSSLVFFIISVLSSHLFLRSAGKKMILIASVLPLTILKNSMRITAITLLSAYVDRGFLTGPLHTSGGILFFAVALTLWMPILWLLRRQEKKQAA
jgi:exosortase